ncbi:hypothetical protein L4D77_26420 [Photobacterium frigidiphilum]|uniref:helix-turn-helix transcriptional regulator n=1 Tax=Photobacterium frigidiphilum TaxID=264736 RepID=UPI003D0C4E9E
MHNYTSYPSADFSFSIRSNINVTPSQPKHEEESTQPEPTLSTLDEQSSSLLISHQEVLEMFQITSKATIYKWRQNRGFPNPVTMMPLRWLRSAVNEWKIQVGGCGK